MKIALPLLAMVAAANSLALPISGNSEFDQSLQQINENAGGLVDGVLKVAQHAVGGILYGDNEPEQLKQAFDFANENTANGVGNLLEGLRDFIDSLLSGDFSAERAQEVLAKFEETNQQLGDGVTVLLDGIQLLAKMILDDANLDILPEEEFNQALSELNDNAGHGVADLLQAFTTFINSVIYGQASGGATADEIQAAFNKSNAELAGVAQQLLTAVQNLLNGLYDQN